jgi:IclR family transcriptional regulator, KDG regulon repressor
MSADLRVADYTIAVVEESIQVLQLLLDRQAPMTLAEITRTSGLSKNKTFRILYTLEKHQCVARNSEGAYRLGVRFLHFGQHVQDRLDLRDTARPVLDWLAEQTRESIFLGLRDGDDALCVDARESPHSIRLFARVGQRAPMYAGGVPKVLLAFMDDAERARLLERIELKPLTSSTITERRHLEQVLEEIRDRGVAVTSDDMDEGVHSIAAPIRNHTGQVVAGVSIAGPSERFDVDTIERYIGLICQAAARISARLGNREVAVAPVAKQPASELATPNGRWSAF